MQEIHDEHHEEHPLHVPIIDERPAPPAPAKKHTKRNWILASIAAVVIIGVGLGLGLGLGLKSGGDDKYEPIEVTGANGTTFQIDPALTKEVILEFAKDAPALTPELEKAVTDLIDIAFRNQDYVNSLKDLLAACIRESVGSATADVSAGGRWLLSDRSRRLLEGTYNLEDIGPNSYPGLQGAIHFMLSAGQDFIDALDTPTTVSSVKKFSTKGYSHIPPLLRGDLTGAVQEFVREYDQAFGAVREKMCKRGVGQSYYGSMSVFCDQMTLGACVNGVATLDAPRCGERWRQVIGTSKANCAAKNGAQPTGGVYDYICWHQDPGTEGLAFDDGPSAPAAGLYLGTRILNALSRIYFMDPKISVTDFKQFWKYLWNVEGYVGQQQELEFVQDAFLLASMPKAFSSWVSIFWAGGVMHDNCYHHGAITYGSVKSDCDSSFLATDNAICQKVFPRTPGASWYEQRANEMLERLLSDQNFKNQRTAPNTYSTCMAASMLFYSAVKFGGDSAWIAANTNVENTRTSSPAFTTHRAEGCNVTLPHCAVCNTIATEKYEVGDFKLECQQCEEGWKLETEFWERMRTCVQFVKAFTVVPSAVADGIAGDSYPFELSVVGLDPSETSISFLVTWGDGLTEVVEGTAVNGTIKTVASHRWQTIGTFPMTVELMGTTWSKFDGKSVSVEMKTKRPSLTITPASVKDVLPGDDVALTLAAADLPSDVGGVKFVWNWNDNTVDETSEVMVPDASGSVSKSITHKYKGVGPFMVTARVENAGGTTLASATAEVSVKAPDFALTIDPATVTGGIVGTAYSFTLKVSGIPQNVIDLKFEYNFGDGQADSMGTVSGVVPNNDTASTTISHTYKAGGSFELVATVKYAAAPLDAESAPAKAMVNINAPEFGLTIDPATVTGGAVGTAYSFILKAVFIPDYVIGVTFDYNFGDGQPDSVGTVPSVVPTNGAASTTISHTYKAEGSFGLVATVKYVAAPLDVVSPQAQALVTIGVSTDRNQTLSICETWTAAQSGGNGATTDTWNMTGIPPGATLELQYNANSIPDSFKVSYQGAEVFSSGWRGDPEYNGRPEYPGGVVGLGQGTATLFQKASDDAFRVLVLGPDPGTVWDYSVRCTMSPTSSPAP